MLFKSPISQHAVDAYLNETKPKERSGIVPWVFALGGTGVMLMGAFGTSTSSESNRLLMMLGGSACEAVGIAWLAPATIKKLFTL
jgi:hypothetical protein